MSSRPFAVRPLRLATATALAVMVLAPGAQAQTAPPQPGAPGLELALQTPDGAQVLQGDLWSAVVSTSRYAPGITAHVTFASARIRLTRSVTLEPEAGTARGTARVQVPARLRQANRIVVRAAIPAGQPVPAAAARTTVVRQVPTTLRAGARGLGVRVLQRMLARDAYAIGKEGVYDGRTQRAVLAFRKVARMGATTAVTPEVFQALRAGTGRFVVRFPSHGRHVEVDVDRRVLAEIDGGKPLRIFHTSPGKASTPTIRGSFRVYRKEAGTNALGMYMSSYFIRGFAVHGFRSVPARYAASHGCLRVPMEDASSIYAFMTIGMRVDTY